MIRSRTSIIIGAIFVITQIAIPAYLLSQPRVQRFGWQMYAGIRTPAEFTIIRADGEEPVTVTDYLAQPRADIDYADSLPRYICEHEPDAISVRVTQVFTAEVTDVPCHP